MRKMTPKEIIEVIGTMLIMGTVAILLIGIWIFIGLFIYSWIV